MQYKDYYKILGVEKGATKEEIKKKFRQLAKQYHPDLHPGDEEAEKKFKEINEAYEVLSDDKKRSTYDNFGSTTISKVGKTSILIHTGSVISVVAVPATFQISSI